MQYDLRNDVLMERESHAEEWRPVPVQRLQEAAEAVSAAHHQQPHAVNHQGSLAVRVIKAG